MSSISKPVAGEAEEQSRKHHFPFQTSGEDTLSPGLSAYCTSNVDSPMPPTASEGQQQELPTFSTSTFKGCNDPYTWTGCPTELDFQFPGSSGPESECSQDRPSSIMRGSFSGQDFAGLGQHYPVRESMNMEADTNASTRRLAPSRKRSSANAFSNDHVESDSFQSRQKAKADGGDSSAKERSQLACPFQKQDPHKHHECLKYVLHRIKDVKQHIYRRHKQPDYYCARCGDIFKTADERDEHARTKNCDNVEVPEFEGISEVQKNKLNARSSRGLDTESQWFEMWDIIFPGKVRPESAWAGSHMEEMVPLLRSLWDHKSSSILAMVQEGQTRLVDRPSLEAAVGLIFDCLEDEASASLGKRARGICSQNQRKLMGGQLPKSAPPSKLITESPHPGYAEPHDIFQRINAESEAVLQTGFVFGEILMADEDGIMEA